MLAAPARLRQSADFQLTVRRGARAGRTSLVVHVRDRADDQPTRVGFTVGSQVGGSVVRHRLTRQLRALVAPMLPGLPRGADVVVRALPAAAHCGRPALARDLHEALDAAVRKARA